ncbi:hypothetical protein CRE_05834 [Caenorhabditis remanei]|uniref:Uncharacterized protein n=1 Tax=Caenorhabditis remanei TaxID=31234 RepID=E3MNL2_CAERE|nr:hypothetical protein CRE_05834 [Caenorhabditis remanei]
MALQVFNCTCSAAALFSLPQLPSGVIVYFFNISALHISFERRFFSKFAEWTTSDSSRTENNLVIFHVQWIFD